MNKQALATFAVIALIAGSVFYWFELKPSQQKKNCFARATEAKQLAINTDNNVISTGMSVTRADYDKLFNDEYNNCLLEFGLE
jgi:uncharacterized membrane protein